MNQHMGLKRLLREYKDVENDPSLCPNVLFSYKDENPYLCYFVIHGLDVSGFKNGIYFGSMTVHRDYPLKPPAIRIHTPNGRFKENEDICLTITKHHPEFWSPGIRIYHVLLGLVSFMTSEEKSLAYMDRTPEERQQKADKSLEWCLKNEKFMLMFDSKLS